MSTAKLSWTDDDDVSKNRWPMLALLGFGLMVSLAIVAALNYAPYRSQPSTVVVSFNVLPVSKDLPSFAAEWKSKDVTDAAMSLGLIRWEPLTSDSAPGLGSSVSLVSASAVNLESALDSVSKPNHPDDILVVLLRSHAGVRKSPTHRDQADSRPKEDASEEWRCELLVGGSEPFEFERALQALATNGYRNTIVLADIGDLAYVPSQGLAFNPIASYVQKACDKAKDSLGENQNLWVMCSTSDGQVSHIDRNGKSLFQEACVKAFERAKLSKPDSPISLADYCDSVNRYCAGASNGNQTPILFHAQRDWNSLEACAPKTKGWEQAEKVVWNLGSPPSIPGTSPAGDANDASKTGSAQETGGKSIEPLDDNKLVGTWADIDAIRGYETAGQSKDTQDQWSWRPSDYAPVAWREWIQEMSKKSLQSSKRPLLEPVKDFSDQRKRFEANQDLLATWATPLQSKLSADEANRWSGVREQFRVYFDSVAEITFWRDLVFSLSVLRNTEKINSQAKESLLEDFDKAFEQLHAFRQSLPVNQMENDVFANVGPMTPGSPPLEPLRKKVNREVEELLDQRWTWSAEQRCLTLLRSPLLSARQRQLLEDALREKQIVEVISAPDFAVSVDPERSRRMQIFASAASRMSNWYTDQVLRPASLDTLESILEWGQSYREHHAQISQPIQGSMTSFQRFQRWLYLSIADLAAMEESRNDLLVDPVFYPGNARRILLQPKCGVEERMWIDFRSGGDPVPVVLQLDYAFAPKQSSALKTGVLSWSADSALANQIQLTVDRERWEQRLERAFNNYEFRFKIERTGSLKESLPVDAKIQIDFVHDGDANSRSTLVIPVFQNAESIGLFAIQQASKDQLPIQANSDGDLKLLGPALAKIESHFALQLQNALDKERIARLVIYANDEDRNNKRPIARSEPVQLSKATPTRPSRTTVTFEDSQSVPDAKGLGLPPEPLTSLVCVVEEFASPKRPEGTEAKPDVASTPPSNEVPVDSFRFGLQLVPDKQLGRYVDSQNLPAGKGGNMAPRLQFELRPEFVTQFQPKSIPITIRWWKKKKTLDDLDKTDTDDEDSLLEEKILVLTPEEKSLITRAPKRGIEFDLYCTIDIGGFPRKLRFELQQDGKDPELDKLVGVVPLPPRIVNPVIEALAQGDSATPYGPVVVSKVDGIMAQRLIYPAYDWGKKDQERWSKPVSDAGPILFQALRVTAGPEGMFDGSKGGMIRWQLFDLPVETVDGESRDENETQSFAKGEWPDRTVRATSRFQKTDFSFAFTVTELMEQIPLGLRESKASKRWRLVLDAGNDQKRRFDLVLDRDPPARGKLIGPNGGTYVKVGPKDDVEIKLVPRDPQTEVLDRGGAGIMDGQLWLARKPVADFEKDTAIFFPVGAPGREDREVQFQVQGTALMEAKAKLGAGPYYLHARIFDRAGNVQSEHEPLEID